MIDEDVITNVHLIYQDNHSTTVLVTKKDTRQEKPRTKYMKVRQEFVRERLATGEVEVRYIKTSLMLADLFTKALGGEQFHKSAEALLGKHRFSHFSNRGAVGIVAPTTVESSVYIYFCMSFLLNIFQLKMEIPIMVLLMIYRWLSQNG